MRTAPEVSGDGRLAFVYAVVDGHTLAVDPYVAESPIIEQDLAVLDGHEYMAKPPLPAVLAIPPYAILRLVLPPAHMDSALWKWALTLLVSGGALVAMALVVERLAIEARLPSPSLAALAAAVATPLLVYSTLLMAHALAAALLAGVALAAIRRRPLLVGLLSGALLSTDTVAAAGATVPLAFMACHAVRSRSAAAAGRVGLGVIAGTIPLIVYQAAAFGSPLASMYVHLADPLQRSAYTTLRIGLPQPDVVLALLASPRNGLFTVAPIALLGVVLLVRSWGVQASHRALVLVTGGTAAVTVLAFAALPRDLVFWPDRAEYGPRLLVPILPLLCWPLAALSSRVLAPATLIGAVPQVAAVAIYQPMLNAGATYQVAEVFRRLAGDAPTPSLLGMALPSAVPDRMWTAQIAFFVAVLAGLGRFALVAVRSTRRP